MKSNPSADLTLAFETLLSILGPLLQIEPMSRAQGVTRSLQTRYRTIYSQNSHVNNTLLCLNGGVEDLIVALGFTASEIGNPDLKPNFVFKHEESEAFV